MTDAEAIRAAAARFLAAINQMLRGDAAPAIACWSEADDVTYLDPQGGLNTGRAALVAYYRRAAEAYTGSGPTAAQGDTTVQVSGDLAFVVVAEHVTVPHTDGTPHAFTAYSTNGFRREGGEWNVIHRHSGTPQR